MKAPKFITRYGIPLSLVLMLTILAVIVPGYVWKEIFAVLASLTVGYMIWDIVFLRKVGRFDRVISGGIGRQLGLLLSLALFLLALIFVQVVISPFPVNDEYVVGEKVLAAAHRFLGYEYYGDEHPGTGLLFLLVSFLGTTVVGGLFITTFSNIIQQRNDKLEHGLVRYRLSGHYVILGFNEYTIPLLKRLLLSDAPHVVIMTSGRVMKLRAGVQNEVGEKDLKRVFIYSGSIVSEQHLGELCLPAAREVFILGEDGEERSDVRNMESARLLKLLRWNGTGDKPPVLKVNILLSNPQTYATVRSLSFPKYYYSHLGQTVTYLRPFNIEENIARRLWGYPGRLKQPQYDPLDFRSLVPGSSSKVHLFIVGFNDMGRALLLEALRVCHYPNYDEATGDNKTIVTLIDPDIEVRWKDFISEYRGVEEIRDVEIRRVAARIEDGQARALLESSVSATSCEIVTVAFCFWEADASYSSALQLPDSLYYYFDTDGKPCVRPNDRVRILVRQPENAIIDILEDAPKYRNIRFFGAVDDALMECQFDDTGAMLAGAFYALKFYSGDARDSKSRIIRSFIGTYGLGENESLWSYMDRNPEAALALAAQLWYVSDEQARFSNRYQVEMYDAYERYESLVPPDALSRMEHLRWVAERLIVGFRKFPYVGEHGTVAPEWKAVFRECKAEYKLHNLLIPHKDLPAGEKVKDEDVIVNRRIIQSVMAGAGRHAVPSADYESRGVYIPSPVDTGKVALPDTEKFRALIERLSENSHDIWGSKRKKEGWDYGEIKDDLRKEHPDMMRYTELSEAQKRYDREGVTGLLRLIYALDYTIDVPEDADALALTYGQGPYEPRPIDVDDVELDPEITAIAERLAENAHEVWAKTKLQDGWRYGPLRDNARKIHPEMIPYDELKEGEKEYDRAVAMGTLKAIVKLGCSFRPSTDRKAH